MICNPGLLNRKVTIYQPTVVEGDDLDTQQDRVLFKMSLPGSPLCRASI